MKGSGLYDGLIKVWAGVWTGVWAGVGSGLHDGLIKVWTGAWTGVWAGVWQIARWRLHDAFPAYVNVHPLKKER